MPLSPDTQLNLVTDYETLTQALNFLGQRRPGWLGIDTETTGLEWWWPHSKMRVLQIGDETEGWAIPWDFAGAFRKALPDYIDHHPVVMHHTSFDLHWMREAGFDIGDHLHRNIHDTMVMARLADPLKPGGLKSVATRIVDPMAGAGDALLHKAFREHGWWWDTVPIDFPIYWQYAALDPVLTVHVANQLFPLVGHTEIYEIERVNAVTISYHMERLGVFVNQPYVEERSEVIRAYLPQLAEWIHAESRGAIDNPGSDTQVRRFLLEQGCEFTKITPKLQKILHTDRLEDALSAMHDPEVREQVIKAATPKSGNEPETTEHGFPIKYLSLDSESLAAIGHPVAQGVKYHRDQQRILSTYLNAYATMTDPRGYLHSSIMTMEAVTGRMSISKPSMQNIPRDQHPRNAIMASPGNRLVLSDFDQIEMRLMAHYAQDHDMIAYIAEGDRRAAAGETGYDVHSQNTRLVYRIPMDQPVPKPARDRTKNTGFACVPLTTRALTTRGYRGYDEVVACSCAPSLSERDELLTTQYGPMPPRSDDGARCACGGDLVLTHQGYQPVLEVVVYDEPAPLLLLEGRHPLYWCTPNHRVPVRGDSDDPDPVYIPAEQITPEHTLILHPLYRRAERNVYTARGVTPRSPKGRAKRAEPVWCLRTPASTWVAHDRETDFACLTGNTIYGAGDERVAITSGTSVAEAAAFRQQFLGTFPGIERYARALEHHAWTMWNREGVAYVEAQHGRRWYIPHPNDSYKLVNYTIQGEAAVVLKRALIRLREQGLTEYMRLPVHDEIILDVPESETEDVARIVPQIMRDDSYRVPLTADAAIYDIWGSKYK